MSSGDRASSAVEPNRGWRDYWKMDRPASCVADNPATRTQIAAWWGGYFASLPDCSRILDIATGNGVVLGHAAEAACGRGARFALTGIDLADIDPPRYLSQLSAGLREARFLGSVAAERLPFEAANFDVAVSQYGLEYADLDLALAEIARVLNPGGRLRWLAHCEDSEVVRQNRDKHRQVDLLLVGGGPIETMESLVQSIARGHGMQQATTALAGALRKAERFCIDHPPAAIVQEVCRGLADVASRWQAYFPRDIAAMLRDTRHKLLEHRDRIEDLRAAVITPEREQRVCEILGRTPWQSLHTAELRVGAAQGSIGIVIEARRATPGEGAA